MVPTLNELPHKHLEPGVPLPIDIPFIGLQVEKPEPDPPARVEQIEPPKIRLRDPLVDEEDQEEPGEDLDDLQAMVEITSILDPFDQEDRERILASVQVFLGIHTLSTPSSSLDT